MCLTRNSNDHRVHVLLDRLVTSNFSCLTYLLSYWSLEHPYWKTASLVIWIHDLRSWAVCSHLLGNSSRHLFLCLPRFLFPSIGIQVVSLVVHLPSFLLITWPAHFHFRWRASWTRSFRFVLLLISSLWIRSLLVMPSIRRSIARCVTASLSSSFFVRDHVWDPYVSTGRIHISNSLFFAVIWIRFVTK